MKFDREFLFDLVADVERYPEFVPWWVRASVWKTQGDTYFTRQVVGVAVIRHEFQSQTVLRRPDRIDVTSTDKPFKSLDMRWSFLPSPQGGCDVSLDVDYELRTSGYGVLAGIVSGDGIRRLVDAFEGRAYHLQHHGVVHSAPTRVEMASGLEVQPSAPPVRG
ncbi:MAG: type II toxin-antitoxin system RatA family toxin [Alphaproteobacteria bacterium]